MSKEQCRQNLEMASDVIQEMLHVDEDKSGEVTEVKKIFTWRPSEKKYRMKRD